MAKDKSEKDKKKLKKVKKELKSFSKELKRKEKELSKWEKKLSAREKELREKKSEKGKSASEPPIPAFIPESNEDFQKEAVKSNIPAKLRSAKFSKKAAAQEKGSEPKVKGIRKQPTRTSSARRQMSKAAVQESNPDQASQSSGLAVRNGFKYILSLNTEEDIRKFIEGDARKTIQQAGEKRIRQISKASKSQEN